MNDDNVTHIITAETVGLDQLASFDCKGQAGPGVTFEIACKEVKRLTAEGGRLKAIINRVFDVYTDEADPDERSRKMWDILGEGVSEDPVSSGQKPEDY